MDPFPHRYSVTAQATPEGPLTHTGALPTLLSDRPAQFGGTGEHWSPEDLLAAAVADCFILTWRAVAAGSKLEWRSVACRADGVLDRVDRVMRFTSFDIHVTIEVPAGTDEERTHRLIEKAEANCLVTNSLTSERRLHATVVAV